MVTTWTLQAGNETCGISVSTQCFPPPGRRRFAALSFAIFAAVPFCVALHAKVDAEMAGSLTQAELDLLCSMSLAAKVNLGPSTMFTRPIPSQNDVTRATRIFGA